MLIRITSNTKYYIFLSICPCLSAKMIKCFISQRSYFSLSSVALMPTWNHFCTFSSNLLLRSRFSNENVISERAPSAQSHSHRWSSVSLPLYAGRSCFIPGCFSLRGKRYGLQSLRAFIVLGSADWACWREIVEGNREMRWAFFSSSVQHQSVQAPHKRTQGHLGRHSRTDCCLKCKTVSFTANDLISLKFQWE